MIRGRCARAVTLRSVRRNRNAVELMTNLQIKAPTGKPDFADMLRRATAHHQRGQLDEAETLYRQVLAAEPDNFNALHLCGVLMHQRRQPAEALKLIARALKTNARSAPAHSNYGIVLAILERHEEALESYDRALALQPGYAEVLNNRGNALRALQRTHDAFVQDWRWMRDRVDSPWYPTARLFRQAQIGDWDGAIAHVAEELAGFVKGPPLRPDNAAGQFSARLG